jgi:hypothetical protein
MHLKLYDRFIINSTVIHTCSIKTPENYKKKKRLRLYRRRRRGFFGRVADKELRSEILW